MRRLWHHPALGEPALGNGALDLLDRHRVVVDVEHAGGLAWSRADQAGELREVVGGVERLERLAPAAAIDEVVPVRDQVSKRAALVAERDPAVHAAPALLPQGALVGELEVLPVVVNAFAWVPLVWTHPVDPEKAPQLAHRQAPAAAAGAASRVACSASARS